jgi:signal recognition particle subunit SRP54
MEGTGMLETLTQGFRNARARLKGYRQITESNIEEALESIRTSLLEADVEFHVARGFIEKVKERAVGELVLTRVSHKGRELQATPADHFINICHKHLVELMGEGDTAIKKSPGRPVSVVMMVGLQGSGKTTTAAKLARNILKDGGKPLLVAADVYRPAAVEQLAILGERVGVPVYHQAGLKPPELAGGAMKKAQAEKFDHVIIDTAGRLAIDEVLMAELEQIDQVVRADNIFLVVDAMIGQDAVTTAREFNRRLDLDGVVLTKLDGDARGGAALSVRAVTGKPIKFVGMGEGMDKLEPFRPDGLATRILGFGDVVGLMQDFEQVVDVQKAEADAVRMLKGDFSLVQFLDQVKMLKKLGPLQDVMDKLPFFPDGMPAGMKVDDRNLVRIEAIVQSMTAKERIQPELLDEKRIARIAKGSGTTPADVKDLLQRFSGVRQMMAQIGRAPGLLSRLPGFKQMADNKALKDMKMEDLVPMMPPPEMAQAGKSKRKFVDIQKRRRKEKLARQQRKKQRKQNRR